MILFPTFSFVRFFRTIPTINLYSFNTNGNRGVAVGLNNLQFWCDGKPLNGRTRAEDDFEPLEAEDEDDFLS